MAHQEIPDFVTKYFWGDNLAELDINRHSSYIIQTVLERGDRESIHWLFSVYTKKVVKEELPNLKLSSKSSNFWNIYLS